MLRDRNINTPKYLLISQSPLHPIVSIGRGDLVKGRTGGYMVESIGLEGKTTGDSSNSSRAGLRE